MRLAKWGPNLRTRHIGMQVRVEAIERLAKDGELILDFAGVDSMSHSFADEAIGKLAAQLGNIRVHEQVRFRNVRPDLRPLIMHVVAARLGTATSDVGREYA